MNPGGAVPSSTGATGEPEGPAGPERPGGPDGSDAPGVDGGALGHLIGALIGLHACMAVVRMGASLHLLEHGRPEWMVGLLLSLFAVAPLALSLWAGRLADRHGLTRPMAVAVVMALAGAAVMVVSQHLAALALGSLLAGGALSVGAVAIQREAGRLTRDPRQLKRIFAWVALGPALSNAVSPVLAGLLIDHVGFRAAFAFGLAMPVLAWWLTGRAAPRLLPPVRAAATGQGSRSFRQSGALALLRLPVLRRLLVINVVLAACWDAHMFVVPVIGHARGLSASEIGLVMGAFAVAASAVRLVITAVGDRLDEMLALRAAMALATVVLLAYAWLPGGAGMMAGSALLGLALGSVQPMVLALLHQVTPHERHGEALGLRMLATNAATVAMPSSFGVLATATSAAAPMWLMAALMVVAYRAMTGLRSPMTGHGR